MGIWYLFMPCRSVAVVECSQYLSFLLEDLGLERQLGEAGTNAADIIGSSGFILIVFFNTVFKTSDLVDYEVQP